MDSRGDTAIREGGYSYPGIDQDLTEAVKEAENKTVYYSPSSYIKRWASSTKPNLFLSWPTRISIRHVTTLDAARRLDGIFKNLGIANETRWKFRERLRIARGIPRTIIDAVSRSKTDDAQQFNKLHTRENAEFGAAYFSHGMIYSPNISIFRDDDGNWTKPFLVDVLSCSAVNAAEVRKASGFIGLGQEVEIEKEMSERMGRILYLFERKGVRNIILGAFGTGVFGNSVTAVARIWAHMILVPEARFNNSFERVIFAVTGEEHFADFQSVFNVRGHPAPPRDP